MNKYINKQ